ncbi:MAG: DUF1552 domain-containing protein [Opitutaceae bacterium]
MIRCNERLIFRLKHSPPGVLAAKKFHANVEPLLKKYCYDAAETAKAPVDGVAVAAIAGVVAAADGAAPVAGAAALVAPRRPPPGQASRLDVAIVSVKLSGPRAKEFWIAPENHARFFPDGPAPDDIASRDVYAAKVMRQFATRAFRIEQRIQRAENFGDLPDPKADTPPEGIPADYGVHMDIMFDLLAMAFQTDSTRVSTLLLAGDGTNRAFPQIGVPEGHHYCSHHRNNAELMAKIAKIDLYYAEHFARFIKKMDSMKDVDGNSVLHNSMIVYGSAHSDGNRHTHDNLPVILAGAGGGAITPGRFAKFSPQPMSNLFLTLNDRMGVKGVDRLGDSTGRLVGI